MEPLQPVEPGLSRDGAMLRGLRRLGPGYDGARRDSVSMSPRRFLTEAHCPLGALRNPRRQDDIPEE